MGEEGGGNDLLQRFMKDLKKGILTLIQIIHYNLIFYFDLASSPVPFRLCPCPVSLSCVLVLVLVMCPCPVSLSCVIVLDMCPSPCPVSLSCVLVLVMCPCHVSLSLSCVLCPVSCVLVSYTWIVLRGTSSDISSNVSSV